MTSVQFSLFGAPPETRHHPCSLCGGTVVVERTADWYEDDWRCLRCGTRGNVSWSREFGNRHEARKA